MFRLWLFTLNQIKPTWSPASLCFSVASWRSTNRVVTSQWRVGVEGDVSTCWKYQYREHTGSALKTPAGELRVQVVC